MSQSERSNYSCQVCVHNIAIAWDRDSVFPHVRSSNVRGNGFSTPVRLETLGRTFANLGEEEGVLAKHHVTRCGYTHASLSGTSHEPSSELVVLLTDSHRL